MLNWPIKATFNNGQKNINIVQLHFFNPNNVYILMSWIMWFFEHVLALISSEGKKKKHKKCSNEVLLLNRPLIARHVIARHVLVHMLTMNILLSNVSLWFWLFVFNTWIQNINYNKTEFIIYSFGIVFVFIWIRLLIIYLFLVKY